MYKMRGEMICVYPLCAERNRRNEGRTRLEKGGRGPDRSVAVLRKLEVELTETSSLGMKNK